MDRLILLFVAITLAWGALAFGAADQWTIRPLLLGAALTGAVAWLRADRRGAPLAVMSAVLLTGLAIALQLVPVDHTTIARLSPGTHRMLSELDSAYQAAVTSGVPFTHSLSVSPRRTLIGLMFLGCTATFTLGVSQWLTHDRLRRLAIIIAAIGVVLALAGIVQRAVAPGLVYGLVNKNHFAGWMLMGLPVTLGLAAGLAARTRRRAAREWRPTIAMLAAFVMMIALLFTMSRSGITTAAASLVLVILITIGRAPEEPLGWMRLAGVAVVALGAAAVAWVGIDVLATRFAPLDTATFDARAGMWRETWRMAGDVPLAGVGIRAFTTASLVYRTTLLQYQVGAAHSDWLQIIAEGGLLVGLPTLCLIAALVATAARRFAEHRVAGDFGATYWIRVGAAGGLFAITVQSLVESGLQMPGNTVLFAVLLAIVIGSGGNCPIARLPAPTVTLNDPVAAEGKSAAEDQDREVKSFHACPCASPSTLMAPSPTCMWPSAGRPSTCSATMSSLHRRLALGPTARTTSLRSPTIPRWHD